MAAFALCSGRSLSHLRLYALVLAAGLFVASSSSQTCGLASQAFRSGNTAKPFRPLRGRKLEMAETCAPTGEKHITVTTTFWIRLDAVGYSKEASVLFRPGLVSLLVLEGSTNLTLGVMEGNWQHIRESHGPELPLKQWTHVAILRERQQQLLFFNGSLVHSVEDVLPADVHTFVRDIYASSPNYDSAPCVLVDVRDYERALEEEEIQSLAAAGVPARDEWQGPPAFEVVEQYPGAKVLSKNPFVVCFEDFLTHEEADVLIKYGALDMHKSQTGFSKETSALYRTSSTNFLPSEAHNDPVLQGVTQRITNLTGVDGENMESFQVLRYEKSEYYTYHHDLIDYHRVPGIRVATFFLYLSDVAGGGETRFPLLNLTVAPKKGRAVLWYNIQLEKYLAGGVSVDDPGLYEKDVHHMSLPVIEGTKWAANRWLHPRNFIGAFESGLLWTPAPKKEAAPDIMFEPPLECNAAPEGPLVVAITVGANLMDLLAEAWISVSSLVDLFLLVDTGSTDDTVAVARGAVGERLLLLPFPEGANDLASALTAGLLHAEKVTGAKWALWLPPAVRFEWRQGPVIGAQRTLERLRCGPDEIQVYKAAAQGEKEVKDRFVRLRKGPQAGEKPAGSLGAFEDGSVRLFNLSDAGKKTVGTLRSFLVKGEKYADPLPIEALKAELEADPNNLEGWYRLGRVYANAGDYVNAISAYERCSAVDGWLDVRVWAKYQTALAWINLKDLEKGVAACLAGLALHPGVPELYWMAGWQSGELGRWDRAAAFAKAAVPHGCFEGNCGVYPRGILFRHPPAHWEGPFDVLRFALKNLGDKEGRAGADNKTQRAMELRQKTF